MIQTYLEVKIETQSSRYTHRKATYSTHTVMYTRVGCDFPINPTSWMSGVSKELTGWMNGVV